MKAKDLKVGDHIAYKYGKYDPAVRVEILKAPVEGVMLNHWHKEIGTGRMDGALVRFLGDGRLPITILRQESSETGIAVVPLRHLTQPWAEHLAAEEAAEAERERKRVARAATTAAWDEEVDRLARCTPLSDSDVTYLGVGTQFRVTIKCDLTTFRALIDQLERGEGTT